MIRLLLVLVILGSSAIAQSSDTCESGHAELVCVLECVDQCVRTCEDCDAECDNVCNALCGISEACPIKL